jgi:ketosteroid isomerase-like protein
VLKFINAINDADIIEMEKLMSDDHLFIDSGGGRYQGKDIMIQGWITFFTMFPDYKIEVIDITENDSIIGVFGYASGTYEGLKDETNSNFYRIPAAWKVILNEGKIKHWQVYCESKRIEEIVKRNI